MRLWHHDILSFIPRSQLLAQWRELNSVFAKEDRHILINYIYEYPKEELHTYSDLVVQEMANRGYKIRSFEKMNKYFEGVERSNKNQLFSNHHNDEYLLICYYNLKEKYLRGQKDFTAEQFTSLKSYVYLKLKKDF